MRPTGNMYALLSAGYVLMAWRAVKVPVLRCLIPLSANLGRVTYIPAISQQWPKPMM
jgi:hypothetical protein